MAPRGADLAVRVSRLRADYTFAVLDAVLVVVAYVGTLSVLSGPTGGPSRYGTVIILLSATLLHLLANAGWDLYGRVWGYASVLEAQRVLLAGATVAIALLPVVLLAAPGTPLGVVLLGPLAATMLIGAMRFRSRLFAWQRRDGRAQGGLRVAVIGTGQTAASIIRDMRQDHSCGFRPVVVIDDDARSHRLSFLDVPVGGGLDDLPSLIDRYEVDQVLLAVASASPAMISRVSEIGARVGVPVKILPGVRDLVRGLSAMSQLRDVRIEDLLGRQEVTTDLHEVARLVSGKRVLITGAGGSIGSQIAAQVSRFSPASLLLLDRDETLLHDCRQSLHGEGVELLADIRDERSITDLMQEHRPDIVFHAAAHKHVPILERFPLEAVRTNVFGTLNVLRAATAATVERFVLISTDKAVSPKSVMGATKWLAEQLVFSLSPADGRYCCVRFGNVLGSRGSVVPTFRRQIAAGGPVTVTDPEMTRFFMSVEEAVQLVLQASVFTEDRDLFMLEMGQPVNILDLARRMINLSVAGAEAEIPIVVTGARPGEKREEQLRLADDTVLSTKHEGIKRLLTPRLPTGVLDAVLERLEIMEGHGLGEESAELLISLASWPHDGETADLSLLVPDQPINIDLVDGGSRAVTLHLG